MYAQRLGNNVNNRDGIPRRRPILVTVASRCARDVVLEKAKVLKTSGDTLKIYIKKDVHQAVRAEWKRLHDAEKTNKKGTTRKCWL